MIPDRIRPLAIGIFRRDDSILVFEGYDPSKGETFYRPLGGAIEFGEYGHQALAREMLEELGVQIADLEFLGISENIFYYDAEMGHEIVLIYEGVLSDPALYDAASMTGREEDGTPFKAIWKSLKSFRRGEAPLYPDGLLELLTAKSPPS